MKKNENKIVIYADGGSRGNPGPAAIGVVFKQLSGSGEVKYKEYAEVIGEKTNNEAEYQAVIFALKKAKALFGSKKIKDLDIEFYLDSELVSKQLGGQYRIDEDKLKNLFVDVWNLRLDFGKINFKHIPREQNKEADRLVNQVLDKESSKLL
ncbi:reverse transcriptase-like protein [Candidatus Parcubacteria bacterium]|nr:MAG: reverse transcriptase-like protein [Candidatus Parcubacteria bacterium]